MPINELITSIFWKKESSEKESSISILFGCPKTRVLSLFVPVCSHYQIEVCWGSLLCTCLFSWPQSRITAKSRGNPGIATKTRCASDSQTSSPIPIHAPTHQIACPSLSFCMGRGESCKRPLGALGMLKILWFARPQPSGARSAYQVLPAVAATPPQSPYIIFPTRGGEERGSDPMGRSMGLSTRCKSDRCHSTVTLGPLYSAG